MFYKIPILYTKKESEKKVNTLKKKLIEALLYTYVTIKDIELFDIEQSIGLAPKIIVLGEKCIKAIDQFLNNKHYDIEIFSFQKINYNNIIQSIKDISKNNKNYILSFLDGLSTREIFERYQQLFIKGTFTQENPMFVKAGKYTIYIYPLYCPGKHNFEITANEYFALLEAAYVFNAKHVGFKNIQDEGKK